jgi:cytochrome c biogenesis protein CcmG/thiol:disulfide interchange protein DsbE
MPRRPILLALLVACLTTAGILVSVRGFPDLGGGRAKVGESAPAVVGTTLDGAAFDLRSLAGKPVLINFWGPGCVPCRDEFPLFVEKLAQHAPDGFTVVGVLMDDPVEPARDFVAAFHGSWPTVIDPDKAIKSAYRVAARPQSYFVDKTGVLRSIQTGWLTDADFERQYALIAP